MNERDVAEEIDDTTAESYMMQQAKKTMLRVPIHNWEQRARAMRAARRLADSLEEMAIDIVNLGSAPESQRIAEAHVNAKFKQLYAQLIEVTRSLSAADPALEPPR